MGFSLGCPFSLLLALWIRGIGLAIGLGSLLVPSVFLAPVSILVLLVPIFPLLVLQGLSSEPGHGVRNDLVLKYTPDLVVLLELFLQRLELLLVKIFVIRTVPIGIPLVTLPVISGRTDRTAGGLGV